MSTEAVPESVVLAVQSLLRAERAVRTYPLHHPACEEALADSARKLDAILPLDLEVKMDGFAWQKLPLLETLVPTDLPGRLYRDGVRALRMRRGLELDELRRFTLAMALPIDADDLSEDYVTRLWEADLPHVQILAVDPYIDLESPDDVLEGKETPTEEIKELPDASSELNIPPPPDEAFRVSSEDAQRIAEEVEAAKVHPPWESFVGAIFEILSLGETEARTADLVRLLEATFQRLLSEGRFHIALSILERLRDQAPEAAGPAIRESLTRMSRPDRLSDLQRALEARICPPELVAGILLLLGDDVPDTVCEFLEASNEETARRLYIDVLVMMGDPAFETVLECFRRGSEETRVCFTRVLYKLRDPRAIPVLIEKLPAAPQALRREIVRTLAVTHEDRALERLLDVAMNDDDPSCRIIALLALTRGCPHLDHEPLLARVQSREFVGLSDQEKNALFRAVAAIGGEKTVPFLRKRLQPRRFFGRRSSGDWERCADALARIGTSSAIQLLANLAQSKNAELAAVCGAAFVSSRKEGS